MSTVEFDLLDIILAGRSILPSVTDTYRIPLMLRLSIVIFYTFPNYRSVCITAVINVCIQSHLYSSSVAAVTKFHLTLEGALFIFPSTLKISLRSAPNSYHVRMGHVCN